MLAGMVACISCTTAHKTNTTIDVTPVAEKDRAQLCYDVLGNHDPEDMADGVLDIQQVFPGEPATLELRIWNCGDFTGDSVAVIRWIEITRKNKRFKVVSPWVSGRIKLQPHGILIPGGPDLYVKEDFWDMDIQYTAPSGAGNSGPDEAVLQIEYDVYKGKQELLKIRIRGFAAGSGN